MRKYKQLKNNTNPNNKTQSLHGAHIKKIKSLMIWQEATSNSDRNSISYRYRLRKQILNESPERSNSRIFNLKNTKKQFSSSLGFAEAERSTRQKARNNILLLNNSCGNRTNNAQQKLIKSKFLIMRRFGKNKINSMDLNPTKHDSYLDMKKSSFTVNKTKIHNLSIKAFPTISKPHATQMTIGHNNITNPIDATIDSRCKSAHLSGLLTNESLMISQYSIINNNRLVPDNITSFYNLSESFQSTRGKLGMGVTVNNQEKDTLLLDNYRSSNENEYTIGTNPSTKKNSNTYSKCPSLNIEKKSHCLYSPETTSTKKSFFCIKKYNNINILKKLIDNQILEGIDSKNKDLKLNKITKIIHYVENKANFTPIPDKSNIKLESNLTITSTSPEYLFKKSYLASLNIDKIADDKNTIKMSLIVIPQPKPKTYQVTLSHPLAVWLIDKYYPASQYLFKKNRYLFNKQRTIIIKLSRLENKYYTNKLKVADIDFNTIKQHDIFKRLPLDSSYRRKSKKKKIFKTTINHDNHFKEKLFQFSKYFPNQKTTPRMIFDKITPCQRLVKKSGKNEDSILKPSFYSRGFFDATKLIEFTNMMGLRPRCKLQNLDIKIIDEQVEMKKNKNMSKESLDFRTICIKMKMKEQLKSIEEILFFLIKETNYKEFKNVLERFSVSVESRDKKGNTFLIYAVECSFKECAIYLIQKGAEVNAKNSKLNTALHIALTYHNYDLADLLIKSGADESLINDDNMTPWQCLVQGE